jgi:hypothetical protein
MLCTHCQLELDNCDFCFKGVTTMEVGVFSGERLNIDCVPLADELIKSCGYMDYRHLMDCAIREYIGFSGRDGATKTQVTLNTSLGRKKVSLPESLIAAAKDWAKKKAVDFSYVCTMAVKDLHTKECPTAEIPY